MQDRLEGVHQNLGVDIVRNRDTKDGESHRCVAQQWIDPVPIGVGIRRETTSLRITGEQSIEPFVGEGLNLHPQSLDDICRTGLILLNIS